MAINDLSPNPPQWGKTIKNAIQNIQSEDPNVTALKTISNNLIDMVLLQYSKIDEL